MTSTASTRPRDRSPWAPRTTLDADTRSNESDTVTVTAKDPAVMFTATEPGDVDGDGIATQEVTITIKNVNEAPMMAGGATRVIAHDENTAITEGVDTYTATDAESSSVDNACVLASCTWSVSGTDAGDFEISNEDGTGTFGALTFKKVPNYEMPADSNGDNVYMVTVVVSDGKLTAMRDVTITITNVNEAGTVTLSSEQPKVGIALTATLEDPDGVVADSVKWTWHNGAVPSDDNDISMATSDTYTPKMADVGQPPCRRRRATPTDKGLTRWRQDQQRLILW